MDNLRRHLWLAILSVGLVLTALYAIYGDPADTIIYYAAVIMSLSAAIFAFWIHKPRNRLPWYFLISGIALLGMADLVWDYYAAIFGHEAGNPSAADILYVAGFATVTVAFLRWGQYINHGNDREDSLDAGIVAIGMAVIAWMFILEPRLGDSELGLSGQILSLAYPILDLFLLAMLVHILMRRGIASYRALVLFSIGTLAFGISDVLWGWGELTETYSALELIADSGWMLCYVFWGAAAVDPTVASLDRKVDARAKEGSYLSTRRAALLVGTAVLVPGTLILRQFNDLSLDMLVFTVGAAALFALVVSRMQLIVRSLETAMEKQAELQDGLEFAAYHDPLTGLANRALLNASLEDMIEQRRQRSIALLFLDLDNFKDINDRLGHAIGDRLLIQVAMQLEKCIRPQDLIGRMGGDEFVILLRFDGEPPLDASVAISEKILESFASPLTIDGHEVQIGASIGIAWLGNDHVSVDSILRAADHAMYDAKREGKNRYSFAPVLSTASGPGDAEEVVGETNPAVTELRQSSGFRARFPRSA